MRGHIMSQILRPTFHPQPPKSPPQISNLKNLKSQISNLKNLKSQISNLKSQISNLKSCVRSEAELRSLAAKSGIMTQVLLRHST